MCLGDGGDLLLAGEIRRLRGNRKRKAAVKEGGCLRSEGFLEGARRQEQGQQRK